MEKYSAECTASDAGDLCHYRVTSGGRALSYAAAIDAWQHDLAFLDFFIDVLMAADFPAYFWETPPVTVERSERDFEFVLAGSRALDRLPCNRRPFAAHFRRAGKAQVTDFSNLGGDAHLVIPCPATSAAAFPHLGAFVRAAERERQRALWQRVGACAAARLSADPMWISTAGMGVAWLHVRLDSAPKYYTHRPYARDR